MQYKNDAIFGVIFRFNTSSFDQSFRRCESFEIIVRKCFLKLIFAQIGSKYFNLECTAKSYDILISGKKYSSVKLYLVARAKVPQSYKVELFC